MMGDRATLRDAERLYDEAENVEGSGDTEAALPLYVEVIRRVNHAEWPASMAAEARGLVIYAEHAVALIHDGCGRVRDAHRARERIVDAYLESGPTDAAEPIVDAALKLAGAHEAAGSPQRALELIDRVIARYGHPDVPGYSRTIGLGNLFAAWQLEALGLPARAYTRYTQVIATLRGTDDAELRFAFADAMVRQAGLAFDNGRPRELYDLYREVATTFDPTESPEIEAHVRTAQAWLDKLKFHHRLVLALPRWPR